MIFETNMQTGVRTEREYTAAELAAIEASKPTAAELEATRKAAIKTLSGKIIIARYPRENGKQSNMLSRDAQLKDIASGRYYDPSGILQPARVLTASEIAELGANSAVWSWIQAMIATSNLAEANGTALDAIVWPVAPV